jgi:hypothetical protein
VPTLWKSDSLNLLETSGPVQACAGIALPFNTNTVKVQYIQYMQKTVAMDLNTYILFKNG